MLNTSVPRSVVSIKVLHTPRLFTSAQPTVLRTALPWDARVGEPQLPVGLPAHLHLPVVATLSEALLADYVQSIVKTGGFFWDVLPGVYVCGRVTFRRDDQLWVGSVSIKGHISSICVRQNRSIHTSYLTVPVTFDIDLQKLMSESRAAPVPVA